MKSRFAKKWVSLKTLSDTFGEDCMPSDFEFFYEKNEMDYEESRLGCERSYVWEMKRRQEKNGVLSFPRLDGARLTRPISRSAEHAGESA